MDRNHVTKDVDCNELFEVKLISFERSTNGILSKYCEKRMRRTSYSLGNAVYLTVGG